MRLHPRSLDRPKRSTAGLDFSAPYTYTARRSVRATAAHEPLD